jgi:hypothetical protein
LDAEGLGRKLRIWKAGSALNSKVEVELLEDRVPNVAEWDIEALVASLGRRISPSPRQSPPIRAPQGSEQQDRVSSTA